MNKVNAILIVMGLSWQIFASEPRITTLKHKPVKVKQAQNKGKDERILSEIMERNKKIQKLLERRTKVPVIWDQRRRILTGKVIRGTLLNSIYSTNLKSPVLIKAERGQGLPFNSKFSCFAVTKHKRVHTLCNKLITDQREIPVSAQILNDDGSAGLVGDYEGGREEFIAGAVASNFAQGVFAASKSKLVTPTGQVDSHTLKNMVLEGLIRSGETTADVLLEEMNSVEPIVRVMAGTKVLIYFLEEVRDL